MEHAKLLIKEFTTPDERLYYFDIVQAMLDEQGHLLEGIFKWDGIHLNHQGYEIWTSVNKISPGMVRYYDELPDEIKAAVLKA